MGPVPDSIEDIEATELATISAGPEPAEKPIVRSFRGVLDGWSQKQKKKTMDGVRELDKFDADLNEDMGEEEEGDPAAAVEPPTTRLKRRDLPKKNVLKTLLTEAVEAGMKAAADKGDTMIWSLGGNCAFRQLVGLGDKISKEHRVG